MKQFRFLRLAGTLAFCVAAASIQAAVVLDNTDLGNFAPIPAAPSSWLSSSRLFSKGFVSPASGTWKLDQVRLTLHSDGVSASQDLILRLYAADDTYKPTGSSLASTTVTLPVTATRAYFYPIELTGAGWTLAPLTKYAFVVNSTNSGINQLSWDYGNSARTDYGNAEGFVFQKTAFSINGGTGWTVSPGGIWNGFTLEASVPEPTAIAYSLVLLGGVGGYVAFRRRARA